MREERKRVRWPRAIAGAVLALLVLPTVAVAQQAAKVYRVGILTVESADRLRPSLRDLGYIEGQNAVLEVRDAAGRPERLEGHALELVRLKVDVIVATYPGAVFSAKRATTTIPIVMVNTPDPVQLGLVRSLAHPGGNITGTTTLSAELSLKQLEFAREAVPRASRIAILSNPDNPWHPIVVKELRDRQRSLGVQLQMLEARSPEDFDRSFQAMVREHAHAVLVLADPMTATHRVRLAELAVKHHIPMMGGTTAYPEAGALMSYWADQAELSRRTASYVDKILKGARPENLPIEQPTKYELVVNLKTAKALGLTIPESLLGRADRVIQ